MKRPTLVRTLLRITTRALLGVAGFIGLYLLAAWVLPMITVNNDAVQPANGTTIFIRSNGVHTDLVLPLRTAQKDWTRELSFAHTASQDTAMRYVAFGWGDKGFYLETPTWADLKASTAIKAMFWMSSSAMHVTYHTELREDDHCRMLHVSDAAFVKLVAYIGSGFQRDATGQPQWILGHSYDRNDCFYDARGTYNLFFTCNTWANDALKQSGLKACLWTPFDTGLLRAYAPAR